MKRSEMFGTLSKRFVQQKVVQILATGCVQSKCTESFFLKAHRSERDKKLSVLRRLPLPTQLTDDRSI